MELPEKPVEMLNYKEIITTGNLEDNTVSDATTQQPSTPTVSDILTALTAMAAQEAETISFDEAARLKQQFYQLHNEELRQQKAAFIEGGGAEADFVPAADENEENVKELLNVIKEKKAAMRQAIENERQANLEKKRALVKELTEMSEDTDNVNRHFQRAREIQTEFTAIGEVSPTESTALWKEYQEAVEHFYDQWKVNKELRDYDFKKNLADKEALIAEAAKLVEEEDIIVAFNSLQKLHEQWREIGPVAKELREEIWTKFKEHSSAINKRYQTFFEERKAREQENENAKTALCERIETLDLDSARTYAKWDELTKAVITAQEEWKGVGYASRKANAALFTRFRAACDNFFARKAEYFRTMKEELNENLLKKTALCEQAEALKDSTDWRKTSDRLVELQKEWKEIGTVAKRHSDAIWKRFQEACDYFFEQKKQATSSQRKEERDNLKAKQEIIEKLKELGSENSDLTRENAIKKLNELRAAWQSVGHVPFKEKDKVQETYRVLVGELYKKLDVRETRSRMASFENSIKEIAAEGGNRLGRERERLARVLENRRQELHTYENNMGFLSSKSKSGDSLLREMERKMNRIREDIADLENKIRLIDEQR
ncbi:MAG: DUF349 domain-containing protein [Paramuribaculum sp.]|nr:DUF349 domain-containing protein [Paramuribaculum sp.]